MHFFIIHYLPHRSVHLVSTGSRSSHDFHSLESCQIANQDCPLWFFGHEFRWCATCSVLLRSLERAQAKPLCWRHDVLGCSKRFHPHWHHLSVPFRMLKRQPFVVVSATCTSCQRTVLLSCYRREQMNQL